MPTTSVRRFSRLLPRDCLLALTVGLIRGNLLVLRNAKTEKAGQTGLKSATEILPLQTLNLLLGQCNLDLRRWPPCWLFAPIPSFY